MNIKYRAKGYGGFVYPYEVNLIQPGLLIQIGCNTFKRSELKAALKKALDPTRKRPVVLHRNDIHHRMGYGNYYCEDYCYKLERRGKRIMRHRYIDISDYSISFSLGTARRVLKLLEKR